MLPTVQATSPVGADTLTLALRIWTGVVIAVALVTLYSVSVPGTYFLLFMFLQLVWLAVGVVWLILVGLSIRTVGFRGTVRPGYLVAMAVVVTLTAAAVVNDVPLRLRFEASRPALDELVAQVGPGATEALTGIDRQVGWFDAERIEPFAGGFRFLVADTGFLDPVGFAYSPDGEPPNIGGEDWYEPYHGPWWIWVESW